MPSFTCPGPVLTQEVLPSHRLSSTPSHLLQPPRGGPFSISWAFRPSDRVSNPPDFHHVSKPYSSPGHPLSLTGHHFHPTPACTPHSLSGLLKVQSLWWQESPEDTVHWHLLPGHRVWVPLCSPTGCPTHCQCPARPPSHPAANPPKGRSSHHAPSHIWPFHRRLLALSPAFTEAAFITMADDRITWLFA